MQTTPSRSELSALDNLVRMSVIVITTDEYNSDDYRKKFSNAIKRDSVLEKSGRARAGTMRNNRGAQAQKLEGTGAGEVSRSETLSSKCIVGIPKGIRSVTDYCI